MPVSKIGERPYLAPPKTQFSGPDFGLFLARHMHSGSTTPNTPAHKPATPPPKPQSDEDVKLINHPTSQVSLNPYHPQLLS